MPRGRLSRLLPAALAVTLAACSTQSGTGPSGSPGGNEKHTLTVYAASSLKDVFTLLAKDFAAAHPGVEVVFSFGASSTLAQQLEQGAPADVFASASPSTMETAVTAGAVKNPAIFATNVLAVATPTDNPAHVTALADLAQASVKVAVCQPAAPCGAGALKLFAKAGLAVHPVSEEPDVKSVLAKVELGEVDAGIVYSTDVLAAGSKVHGVSISASSNVATSYPIGLVTSSNQQATAAEFVSYVLSSDGRKALLAAGFGSP